MIEQNDQYKGKETFQAKIFQKAIDDALEETKRKPNGAERIYAIDQILFKKRMTYTKASQTMFYHENVIKGWIRDFVKLVGKNAGF